MHLRAFIPFIYPVQLPACYEAAVKKRPIGYLETYGGLSAVLIMTVLPIVFSSVAYNISIVVDNSIYGISMASMGMGAPEIAANWGIYSGKYRLLFKFRWQ